MNAGTVGIQDRTQVGPDLLRPGGGLPQGLALVFLKAHGLMVVVVTGGGKPEP